VERPRGRHQPLLPGRRSEVSRHPRSGLYSPHGPSGRTNSCAGLWPRRARPKGGKSA
jgi:hypothetical protein